MTPRSSRPVDPIADFYDRVTDPYTQAWNGNLHMGYWRPGASAPTIEEATEALTGLAFEHLRTSPGDRVLDVGCGIGKPALRLAQTRSVEVVGISVSESQVATATATASAAELSDQVSFSAADVEALPYADDSFDAALCLEVLHHVENRSAALREIARVVRPGGSVVVVDFALRGAVPKKDQPLVDDFSRACNLVTLTTIDAYERDVNSSGMTLLSTLDVSSQVAPSMRQHAEAMYSAREQLSAVVGADQLERMIDLTERYSDLPQFGYVVLAAISLAAR